MASPTHMCRLIFKNANLDKNIQKNIKVNCTNNAHTGRSTPV